ncbi:uncharacterized protein L3040_001711 [Drepanopeziza brunnea f. sp. 'multigermtubi']|uniref:uncharacterized protein n=1 Tax=Drepanopeziza brunnea f. sp. 'multigermtubi' TaxID=698441 RepID=UPI0023958328|nr:hypothetical protein L3040_001711 [Drepanopeziza brunnea f. sp. 'multigermtubi']
MVSINFFVTLLFISVASAQILQCACGPVDTTKDICDRISGNFAGPRCTVQGELAASNFRKSCKLNSVVTTPSCV